MLHVAGFYHEMRRFDRDDHVTVNWENILPGILRYFSKQISQSIKKRDGDRGVHFKVWYHFFAL